jgi:hypothetical protein
VVGLVLLFILLAFGALSVLSVLFGVDSRDGFTDPHSTNSPVGLS